MSRVSSASSLSPVPLLADPLLHCLTPFSQPPLPPCKRRRTSTPFALSLNKSRFDSVVPLELVSSLSLSLKLYVVSLSFSFFTCSFSILITCLLSLNSSPQSENARKCRAAREERSWERRRRTTRRELSARPEPSNDQHRGEEA